MFTYFLDIIENVIYERDNTTGLWAVAKSNERDHIMQLKYRNNQIVIIEAIKTVIGILKKMQEK